MKRSSIYFVLLLVAIFLTISVVNIASAISIETWNYNLKEDDFYQMNKAINEYNIANPTANYQTIVENYWASNKTEVKGDYKDWIFDNLLGVEYLLIKAGKQTELFYVGYVGSGSFTWKGIKGLSHFSTISPVPEPATMLLLGTGLAALVAFKKRMSIKT